MDSAQDRRLAWAHIVICPAICALFFAWPTFDAPFQPGDDYNLVLSNPHVRDLSLESARALATSIHGDLYQPLPMVSYQLNFAAAGERPFSYHVVNAALHAACAILAAALAFRLSGSQSIACLTGVLFAIHPLAMDAVAWVSGRILLMAALFALTVLNLVAYRRPRPGAAWALGTVFAGAGMLLSKVIPGVPLAAAWVDAWSHEPHASLRKRPLIWWLVMATFVAATVLMVALSLRTERTTAMADAAEAGGVPAGVRMLLALRYYIENYFVPTRLTEWSPVPREAGWASPDVWIAALEAAALIVLALMARRRAPVAMVGICLFALLLLPFLAAVGVRNFLTADRYMYLPMAGLHLAVATAMIEAAKSLGWRYARLPVGAAVFAALVALLVIGRREADMRRDFVAVARRAMTLHPDDVRIPVKLSKRLTENGRPREALETIAYARRQWPDDPGLAGEAGAAHRALGDWGAAFRELSLAIAKQPDDIRAKYHLALTLDDLNRPEAAAAQYREILAARSDYVPAATALARNLRRSGNDAEALAAFEQALKTNPHHRGALLGAAEILRDLGRAGEAEPMLRGLLSKSPDDRKTLLDLQYVLWTQGNFASVVGLWRDATAARPDNSEWAAWHAWAEVVQLLADEQRRPTTDAAILNDSMVASFAIYVRLGRLESPTHLTALTHLPGSRSEADDESLLGIQRGLSSVGQLRRPDPVVLYATSVALALRGEAQLAQRLREQLRPIGLAWDEPMTALDAMLSSRKAATRPATSP